MIIEATFTESESLQADFGTVYNGGGGGGGNVIVDSSLSASSKNPVQNKVVTNALNNKQDKLTFDSTPRTGSTNPVTSSGIKSAIDNKAQEVKGYVDEEIGKIKTGGGGVAKDTFDEFTSYVTNTMATKYELTDGVTNAQNYAIEEANRHTDTEVNALKDKVAETYATKEELAEAVINGGGVDVSSKLDKVTSATQYNQAYVKKADGTQGMVNIVSGVGIPAEDVLVTGKAITNEIEGFVNSIYQNVAEIYATKEELNNKVIEGGGVVVDDALDGNSKNPVQNKVIKEALDGKVDAFSYANNCIYATDNENNPTGLSYDYSSEGFGQVPIRDMETGEIYVPETPLSETSATSKKYVDDQIANISSGGGENVDLSGYVTKEEQTEALNSLATEVNKDTVQNLTSFQDEISQTYATKKNTYTKDEIDTKIADSKIENWRLIQKFELEEERVVLIDTDQDGKPFRLKKVLVVVRYMDAVSASTTLWLKHNTLAAAGSNGVTGTPNFQIKGEYIPAYDDWFYETAASTSAGGGGNVIRFPKGHRYVGARENGKTDKMDVELTEITLATNGTFTEQYALPVGAKITVLGVDA